MNQKTVQEKADELLTFGLNDEYDTVISMLEGMKPLEAAAIALQLETYFSPMDPYKLDKLIKKITERA